MEKDKLNKLRKVVLIGGSAGSLDVLLQVLPQISSLKGIALIIVLHRRNSDDYLLEELLRVKSGLTVEEIEDKTPLCAGRVYVAPADYHLLLEQDLIFSLDVSEKIHYSRPSIDVAFESVSNILGSKASALLLSGANADGTEGLKSIKANGGTIAVQSPQSADVSYMPQFALDHLKPDHILTPEAMLDFIMAQP